MKKIFISLLALLILTTPVYAKQLWEYASFNQRAEIATEIGLISSPEAYIGDLSTNIDLLDYLSTSDAIFGGTGGLPVTDYQTTLTAPLTSTASTISVASVTTRDDYALTTADISPAVYLVLEPDSSSKKEIIKCTGISSLTFTGCTRGLAFYGTSEAAVTANQFAHSAGTTVVLSNVHFYYVSPSSPETWTAIQTFEIYPVASSTLGNATTSLQLFTFGQAQALANQGAATSTPLIAGISELATQIEMASSTPFDILSPHVIQSKYATSTPSAVTPSLFVVVTENDGKLNQLFYDLTESWIWTGNNTSTGQFEFDGLLQADGETRIASTTIEKGLFTNATTTGTFNIATTTGQLCFGDSETTDCRSKWGVDFRKTAYWEFSLNSFDNFSETNMSIEPGRAFMRAISTGTNAVVSVTLPGTGSDIFLQGDDTLTVELSSRVMVDDTTNEHCWGLSGNVSTFRDPDYVAASQVSAVFCYDGSIFLARTMNNNNSESTDIGGVILTDWNFLTIEWDGTNDTVKFYVNGVLKVTHSTSTPDFAVDMNFGAGSDATTDEISFSDVFFRYKF